MTKDYKTSQATRLSAAQCRAARAWLGWPRHVLAKHARVSMVTIADFERERRHPLPSTMNALRGTFETNGVAFVYSEGRASGIVSL